MHHQLVDSPPAMIPSHPKRPQFAAAPALPYSCTSALASRPSPCTDSDSPGLCQVEPTRGLFSPFEPVINSCDSSPRPAVRDAVDPLEYRTPDKCSTECEIVSSTRAPKPSSFGPVQLAAPETVNRRSSLESPRLLVRLEDLSPSIAAQVPVIDGVATFLLRGGGGEEVEVDVPAEDVVDELRRRIKQLKVRVNDAEKEVERTRTLMQKFEGQSSSISGEDSKDMVEIQKHVKQVQSRAQKIMRRSQALPRVDAHLEGDGKVVEAFSMRDMRDWRNGKEEERQDGKSKKSYTTKAGAVYRVRGLFGGFRRDAGGGGRRGKRNNSNSAADHTYPTVSRSGLIPSGSSSTIWRSSKRGPARPVSCEGHSQQGSGDLAPNRKAQSSGIYHLRATQDLSRAARKVNDGAAGHGRNEGARVGKSYSFSSRIDGRMFRTT